MTNEEKIEEIVIDAFNGWSKVGFTYEEMIAILSKFAEWKDQQYADIIKEECNTSYESGFTEGERTVEARFKEYLEKNRTNYPDFMCGNNDYTFGMREGYVQAFAKIAKELFKED